MAPSSNWSRRPASQAGNVEFESHRGHHGILDAQSKKQGRVASPTENNINWLLYCGGGAMVAHRPHKAETMFESSVRNQ